MSEGVEDKESDVHQVVQHQDMERVEAWRFSNSVVRLESF